LWTNGEVNRRNALTDLIFSLMTIGFFVLAIGYLRGCEKLR